MSDYDFSKTDTLLRDYISSRRIAGAVAIVTAADELLYENYAGRQDMDSPQPMTAKSIFRIYSMTKPVASVAAMMLYEEGKFKLDDPVSDYIPAFKNTRIYQQDGSAIGAKQQMTIRHILCHTAGITLPAFNEDPLVPLYLEKNIDGMRSKGSLDDVIDRLGPLPVLFEPGSRWAYSMSTDIVGRLIEICSGQTLGDFLQSRLFDPLQMEDTGFQTSAENRPRMTANYEVSDNRIVGVIERAQDSRYFTPPEMQSASGGLVSTSADYVSFVRMLINGGSYRGVEYLRPETVALMTRNHLGADMDQMGAGDFGDTSWKGIGFGLGFHVVDDSGQAGHNAPAGAFGWTGAAGTSFFINPKLGIGAILLAQYMPSNTYPVRHEYRDAVYSAFA